MRPLSTSITRAAAQGTPPAKSAATARARRARRNLPKPAKPPESSSPTIVANPPPPAFMEQEQEKEKEFYDPDLFTVEPDVIKLEPGSAAAAAAAASGSVVVISTKQQQQPQGTISTSGRGGSASAGAGAGAARGAAAGASASRAFHLDAEIASLDRAEVDRRTGLLIALATSGLRFEQVLKEGIRQGLVDEVTLRLLERRLAAARASSKSEIDAGAAPDEEAAAVRGLAVLWSRLKSEVERAGAPPAERAIDDALRELAAGGEGGRERAEAALRQAAGYRGGSGGGGKGGIDILAVAAASELDEEKQEGDASSPSSSSSSSPFPNQIVPAAVLSATCASLLAAARRQVYEVERALQAAREQMRSTGQPPSPAFGRAERLAADRRELVAALQEVLDIANGL